ncbi:MAG: hypothetical protein ACLP6E_16235 [Acidimicrobiales bacterium]
MARQDGQPGDGEGSTGNSESTTSGERPRLTVGQKILVALPDLGRNKRSSRTENAPVSTGAQTKARPGPQPSKPRSSSTTPKPRSTTAAKSDKSESSSDPSGGELPGDTVHEADGVDVTRAQDPDELDDDLHADDQEVAGPAARPTSLVSLLRGGGTQKRSGAAAYDDMKTSELTTLMRKLDDKERRFAMAAAPLGAVLALVLTIITLKHDPVGKGHEATSVITLDGILSVVFAACVFATAWFRRRSLTAFALLFLGYSLGLIGIGIPFLILGGYLLFRAWRIQKVLTSRGVNTRTRSPAKSPAERGASRNQPRSQKAGQGTKGGGSRPVQNKRYTPPKPAPRQPAVTKAERAAKPEKSSWFERATRSTPAEPS